MNKYYLGAAALALFALIKKSMDHQDENPTVTAAQKTERVITFFKA